MLPTAKNGEVDINSDIFYYSPVAGRVQVGVPFVRRAACVAPAAAGAWAVVGAGVAAAA